MHHRFILVLTAIYALSLASPRAFAVDAAADIEAEVVADLETSPAPPTAPIIARDVVTPKPSQKSASVSSPTTEIVPITEISPAGEAPVTGDPRDTRVTIQIGSFATVRRAALVRGILLNIGSVRVQSVTTEQKKKLYRVLVGDFADAKTAQAFIEANNLKRLFPELWVNSINVTNDISSQTLTDAEVDPYLLNLDLYCKDEKRGNFKGEFKPEPNVKGSTVDYRVAWECITEPRPRPDDLDRLRRPTHWHVSPIFGTNSFRAKNVASSEIERSGLVYGLDIGLFKNFGGLGTFINYRLAHHGYGILPDSPTPTLAFEHRFTTGATFHIRDRLEAEPVFGMIRTHYFKGNATAGTFENLFLPFTGVRARVGLLRLSDSAELDFGFGLHTIFGTSGGDVTAKTSTMWTAEIRTRHFNEKDMGVAWFMELTGITAETSIGTQTNSNFLLGVCVYFL